MKIKFTKEPSSLDPIDSTRIEYEFEQELLTDIVQEFRSFLLACQFDPKTLDDFFKSCYLESLEEFEPEQEEES
jgi:hypothetical protein